MELIFQTNPITTLQHAEIYFNQFVQESFHFAEPLWLTLSEYLSPAQLLDIFVPFVGLFHHQLLVRLVCSLSIVNVLSSLVKWCSPEYRPYWWIREYENLHNHTFLLKQYDASCETTAGFPSSHSISFTTFSYLFTIFSLATCNRKWRFSVERIEVICNIVIVLASLCMWLSRMYLATQFLHQCVFSSFAAITLLHIFDKYSAFLYTLSRGKSLLIVCCLGLLPVIVYFGMLRMDVDPHWSVRMAFKWCADPSLLRHELSPIFVLGRDFGYLMGVALSTPMYKSRYESQTSSYAKRIPLLFVIELLNYYARQETPKHLGRFIFVAYEFIRNMLHSYTLLSIVSKLV